MRVITGSARGTKLIAPPGLNTRPTSERVKEAVFSSLFDRMRGAKVLDAFAGSGQLGIEALSRGAKRAVFLETDRAAAAIIKQNLKAARVEGGAELRETGFESYIKSSREIFSLVFIDPPYGKGIAVNALRLLSDYSAVEDGGIAVCESDEGDDMPDKVGDFNLYKRSVYGRTVISYFEKGVRAE